MNLNHLHNKPPQPNKNNLNQKMKLKNNKIKQNKKPRKMNKKKKTMERKNLAIPKSHPKNN